MNTGKTELMVFKTHPYTKAAPASKPEQPMIIAC
jgi:hypothetical protein